MKDVWGKMKSVINQDKTKTQRTVDDGQTYADELNDFYERFDADSTQDDNSQFKIDNLIPLWTTHRHLTVIAQKKYLMV